MHRYIRILVVALFVSFSVIVHAQAKSDKLFKKGGDVINGRVTNELLVFATPYGEIRISPDLIRKYEHTATTDRIFTVLDEIITGHMSTAEVTIDRGYAQSAYQKEIIDHIIFSEKVKSEKKYKSYFEMQNGDKLYGQINNAQFLIFEPDNPTEPVGIDFSYILKIEAANDGMTRVYMTTGDIVTGGIASKQLDVTLNHGFDVAIPRTASRRYQFTDSSRQACSIGGREGGV